MLLISNEPLQKFQTIYQIPTAIDWIEWCGKDRVIENNISLSKRCPVQLDNIC